MMMKREDYKRVKHMDRMQMTAYLQNIYQRGYAAGMQALAKPPASKATPEAEAPENSLASE